MSKLRNADDDFPFRLFYLGEVLPAFRLNFFLFFFAFTSGPLSCAPCETFCTDVLLLFFVPVVIAASSAAQASIVSQSTRVCGTSAVPKQAWLSSGGPR